MFGPEDLKVLERWKNLGAQTEYEVTLEIPEFAVDLLGRGATIDIPDLGPASILLLRKLETGSWQATSGRAVVRLDVTVEPSRYP